MFRFEVCANGVESCLAAQAGGADRVELCAGIPEGGTTPSYGEIKTARKLLTKTRLHVIIRPRGGDFLYSELEVERMIEDIRICKALGADGVVFGCLQSDGTLDVRQNRRLLEEASGMSVTFHRAFDRCANPQESLEQLIDMGFDRVLTSGQQPTAYEGIPLLKELQQQSAGRIIVLAGCGVNEAPWEPKASLKTILISLLKKGSERPFRVFYVLNDSIRGSRTALHILAGSLPTGFQECRIMDELLHDIRELIIIIDFKSALCL